MSREKSDLRDCILSVSDSDIATTTATDDMIRSPPRRRRLHENANRIPVVEQEVDRLILQPPVFNTVLRRMLDPVSAKQCGLQFANRNGSNSQSFISWYSRIRIL